MVFWSAQQGPYWEDHIPKVEHEKQIGTLACPDCGGTLGRFVESPGHLGLGAFMKAESPSAPGSATSGFALYAEITDTEPADEAVAGLHCWRGCSGHYQVDGAMCRDARDRYQATGKKPRILAVATK